MTAQDLITAANGLQLISDRMTALQVEIWLLQQLTGNTMSAQQLITSANGLQLISDKTTADQVIILLLNLAGGGSGSAGGIFAGNYGGGMPNFTPSTPAAIATDTSNNRQWNWYNNQWQ